MVVIPTNIKICLIFLLAQIKRFNYRSSISLCIIMLYKIVCTYCKPIVNILKQKINYNLHHNLR